MEKRQFGGAPGQQMGFPQMMGGFQQPGYPQMGGFQQPGYPQMMGGQKPQTMGGFQPGQQPMTYGQRKKDKK